MPKFPQAVTHTALTEPNGARSLPFPFTVAASANPKLYLPSFFVLHRPGASEGLVRVGSHDIVPVFRPR